MGSRVGIAGLALVLCAGLGWFLGVRDSTRTIAPVAETAQEPAVELHEEPSASATAHEGDEAEHAPMAPSLVDPEESPDLQAPALETWTLWGFVRDELTDNPCAGYRVLNAAGVDALCNTNGMFLMEFDTVRAPPGTFKLFHVYSPEGARVATVRKALEPGLVLHVDQVALLSGRLIDAGGRAVAAEALEIRDPWGGYVASTEVDARNGTFRAPVAAETTEYDALVVHVEFDGATYPLHGATADFLRPEGATLVLDLCDVRFHVRLADEALADSVHLNLFVQRPNERPQRFVRTRPNVGIFSRPFRLDAQGIVDVTLERGLTSVTVEVAPFGYAPWVETLHGTPCGRVWEIALSKLGPSDVIVGRVHLPEGDPLPRAQVSCWPTLADPELFDVVGPTISGTGEDGSFSVPWAQGKSAVISASFGSYRKTRLVEVNGGDRDIELRFEPVQRVVLELIGPAGGPVHASENMSGYWIFLADGEERSGTGTLESIDLEGVPVGRHRACVMVGEPTLFGAVDVDVRTGSDVRRSVMLHPAFSTSGRVLDPAGEPVVGARVRLVDAPWPQLGSKVPFSTHSRADGWFVVFLADQPRAELEISYEGRRPLRVFVEADTPATWTLP